jgi:hypothetical protein
MCLSENDYIYVGAGHLYGPPFLSRFLLYRLFDCNQAILIHHGETGVVSASSHGNVTKMVATEVPITVIYAHCCFESALVSMKELLKLPSVEIPMPRNAPIIKTFEEFAIRLEEFNLSLTEKMMFARENLPRQTLKFRESDYQVTGPVNVSFWPEKVLSSNLTFRCIKLSVAKSNTETDYNIQSDFDWGLTALDMEEDGQPPFEVNLERVAHQKV